MQSALVSPKRSIPFFSGVVLAIGTWILFDAFYYHQHHKLYPPITPKYYVPGIISFLGFVFMLFVPVNQLQIDYLDMDNQSASCTRICMFLTFVILLGGITSTGAFYSEFVDVHINNIPVSNADPWPLIAIFIHTFCILLSALLCIVGRTQDAEI